MSSSSGLLEKFYRNRRILALCLVVILALLWIKSTLIWQKSSNPQRIVLFQGGQYSPSNPHRQENVLTSPGNPGMSQPVNPDTNPGIRLGNNPVTGTENPPVIGLLEHNPGTGKEMETDLASSFAKLFAYSSQDSSSAITAQDMLE